MAERKLGADLDTVVPFASGAPTTTNAGSDTSLRLARPAREVTIQNNTAAIVNVGFDAPATAGSLTLAANGAPQRICVPFSVIHLLTAGAQPINGATAGIVVIPVS